MTTFHSSIRNILSEVDDFFSDTIQKEKLSRKAAHHKEKILDLIFCLREDYPELLPKLSDVSRSDDSLISDLGVRDLRNIAKAGFLGKRRKKEYLFQRGDYQRRYCVIQRNIFYYYISPTDKKQAGAFKLKGYRFRKAPYLPEDSQKKDLSFELSCPGKRSFQFLAETTRDFKEWKDAVEAANGDNSNSNNNSKPDVISDQVADISPPDDDTTHINDDDDGYYVYAKSDDESGDVTDTRDTAETYEEVTVTSSDEQEPVIIENHRMQPEKPKPPPKKAIVPSKPPAKPKKSHHSIKPPMRPRPYVRAESDIYVDCETKNVNNDDDNVSGKEDDDDDDYTDPLDYGRDSYGEFDDNYEVFPDKNNREPDRKLSYEIQDINDCACTEPMSPSDVGSEMYVDVVSPDVRKT